MTILFKNNNLKSYGNSLGFFLIFFLMVFQTQAASLSCLSLFNSNETSVKTSTSQREAIRQATMAYARSLDELNNQHQNFLFKENLQNLLQPDFSKLDFLDKTKALYKSYKLRKILKQLFAYDPILNSKNDGSINTYDIENLAVKLEKLSFLMDQSAYEGLPYTEKVLYKQMQHSLLTKGLTDFLFSDQPQTSSSKIKIILDKIMTPFKEQYFRWSYALIKMPKLNNALIPYEIIQKVILNGYENSQLELKPYILKSNAQSIFNNFSTAYNTFILSSAIFAISQLAYSTYTDIYIPGQIHAQQMLEPGLKQSEELAKTDFEKLSNDLRLNYFIIEFKKQKHRDPTTKEIEMARQLIINANNH